MNKFISVLLCFILPFSLCACGSASQGPADDGDSITPVYEPAPNPDGPLYEGSDIAASPFVGRFEAVYCALDASLAADVYENAELPAISCDADGTFTMTVCDRFGLGYVDISGTFTVDGESGYFTITSGIRDDFMGGDATEFLMKLYNGDCVRYSGTQIATTVEGDLFELATE